MTHGRFWSYPFEVFREPARVLGVVEQQLDAVLVLMNLGAGRYFLGEHLLAEWM
jgi:hypothetical protein